MDVRAYNRDAWNKAVERSDPWTLPANEGVIAEARAGKWSLRLTPTRHVPPEWFPDLQGIKVLGLAAGGGQQGPIFAAAGADVTILDNSPKQLQQDRMVAEREGLAIRLIEGDMKNLEMLPSGYFDLVFNPISTCFVDDVLPVWKESFRVLKSGGSLMTGFLNPSVYMFDKTLENQKILQVRHSLPYSDLASLSDEERARYTSYQAPLEFSHTLSSLIGGQLAAGFHLVEFLEDDWGGDFIDRFMKAFVATKAIKPVGFY